MDFLSRTLGLHKHRYSLYRFTVPFVTRMNHWKHLQFRGLSQVFVHENAVRNCRTSKKTVRLRERREHSAHYYLKWHLYVKKKNFP